MLQGVEVVLVSRSSRGTELVTRHQAVLFQARNGVDGEVRAHAVGAESQSARRRGARPCASDDSTRTATLRALHGASPSGGAPRPRRAGRTPRLCLRVRAAVGKHHSTPRRPPPRRRGFLRDTVKRLFKPGRAFVRRVMMRKSVSLVSLVYANGRRDLVRYVPSSTAYVASSTRDASTRGGPCVFSALHLLHRQQGVISAVTGARPSRSWSLNPPPARPCTPGTSRSLP